MARAADQNSGAIKSNFRGIRYRIPDLADVIDNLGEPFLVLDWQGHIQYLNKAAVSLLILPTKRS